MVEPVYQYPSMPQSPLFTRYELIHNSRRDTNLRAPIFAVAVRDEFSVPVVLKKGENRLTLTISDDALSYGFFARLSDDRGNFMKTVRIQAP
jgi:hypothetical protein